MFALLLLAGCTSALQDNSIPEPAPEAVFSQNQESSVIPGVVIVEVSEELASQLASGSLNTKSSALNSAFVGMGVTRVERVFPDAGEWEPRHRKAGLHRWFRVSYNSAAAPATKAALDFSALDGILSAEPERRIVSESYFNDPYASRQWALANDGSMENSLAGCDINVEPVWANYTGGSSNVIVAVIDHGVQMDHPDLADIMVPASENGSKSFVYGYEGYTIYPGDHGTHCAGVIGAINNNGIGISGIAGGLDGKGGVRIMSCAIFMPTSDPEVDLQGDAQNAMIWAADHGAVIASNSWGNMYDSEEDAKKGGPGAMKAAIDYFVQYAGCDNDGNQLPDSPMKGGLVVFSAGNSSWSMGWPSAYEPVVAVAATTAQFTPAYYTNFGDWVDICAPGGDAKEGRKIFSTIAGSDYGYMQGTSMACPHVSGVAALIVSHFGGPGFTCDDLKERLLGGASTAKVKDFYNIIGPMVDALGSFAYGGKDAPEPASNISVSAQANTLTLTWKVTPDPDDKVAYGYLVVAAKDAATLEGLNPLNIPDSVKQLSVEVGTRSVGDDISVTLTELEFETSYSVAVFAYDSSDHYSKLSEIKTVSTGKNNPPIISTEYAGDYVVKPFEKLSVEYEVSDPDGHNFSLSVSSGSDAFTYNVKKGTVSVVIAGNAAPHGQYTAHIVATDQYGAVTDYPIAYEILENHAPRVIATIPNQLFDTIGKSLTFDLSQYIQDEDGEQLSYSFSMSEPDVVHLNATADKLVLTTRGFGATTATVTATDACKATCSFSFQVVIRDASRPYDLYPNPIKDYLNIRSGEARTVDVTVSSKTGAVVYSATGTAMDPFTPLSVDMREQPGGVYYVKIGDDRYSIVKQ